MAALVTNKTQADPLDDQTMTLATVGGADAAIPDGSVSNINGIDESNPAQFLQTNGASTTANDWLSAHITFAASATYDLSGSDQAFAFHFKQNNLQFNTYVDASDSLWAILFSGGGTTNYARWEMNAHDFINGDWQVIAMSGTPDTTGGTWDNTDVTGFGVAIQTTQSGSNFGVGFSIDQLVYIDGNVVFEDTGVAATTTWESYRDEVYALSGNNFHSDLNLEAKPAFVFGHGILNEADDFSVSNFTLIFQANDGVTGGFQVSTTEYYEFRDVCDSATATHSYTDGVFAYDSGTYDVVIDSATLTSGTTTFSGVTFLNTRNVTIGGNSQATVGAAIPSATGTVDISDVDADLTITGTSSAIQWTADLAANSTITTDSDIDITFAETDLSDINVVVTASNTITVSPTTGSGTYTLTALSRNGASSIEFDNATANNTTISVSSDINANHTVASPTAGGGTITVTGPVDTLTVNSSETGSQIHVYTTNTQTILDSEASASQLTYNHSSETVDITVLKDGFIPFRQTALVLSGDQTIEVSLVASREYDSSHGLTYTTDASIYDNYNVITNITQANPAVVTYSGADNFSNNDIISIQDVVGMTEVNGKRYTVANVNTGANTFELSGINSSAYTAYSSAGIAVSGLAVPTFGPSGRGVFSLLMESFRTETGLRNLPFNIQMDGDSSLYLTNGVEGEGDSDVENLTASGVGYLDVDDATTAVWVGIESVGTIPGTNTGEWTADDATTVTDARTSGVFDEVIKIYGDTDHGNFDNRANRIIMKMNINGYREERINVRALYGVVGNFKPNHYVVPIAPVAIGAATGDPSLATAPTITDHGATPTSWNGKNFRITVTDGSTANSGEDLIRHLNYYLRSANDTSFNSKDPFSWPEMVLEVVAGTSYETAYGYTEDAQTSTLKGVRVVQNDGTTAHPDFTRFQSDDGTYYTAPTVAQISAPNVTSGRVQVYNNTGAAASAWAATTAYSLGDYVLRSTGQGTELGDGVFFVCTTAGTSGGSEPTWDVAANGNTTSDGTVTWTVRPIEFDNASTAGAYSNSWTDGEEFASGDTIRFRWVDADELEIDTTGVATADGTTTFLNTPVDDTVYDGYAIDGSTVTEYSADYPNVQVDLNDPDNVFYMDRFYAWHKYNLTLEDGIRNFFGAVTATNASNIVINDSIVDIFFDNTKAVSARQGDNIVIQRDDGAYPQVTVTSGGGGLGFYYTGVGYTVETGVSGLTAEESAKVTAMTFTKSNELDVNIKSVQDTTVTGVGTSGDPWGP